MGKLRLREVKQPFGNHPARREELGGQNQAAPSPGPQMLHWAGAGVRFRAESTHCKTQVRPRVTGEMGEAEDRGLDTALAASHLLTNWRAGVERGQGVLSFPLTYKMREDVATP